jgi:hypothetical protein
VKHVFHPRAGYERNAAGDWRPAGTPLARRAPATWPRPTNGWTKPEAASFIHVRCPPMGRLHRGSVGRALRDLRARIAHTVHHATTRSDASATCRASLRTGSGRFGSLQDPPRRRVVRRRVRAGQGTDTLLRIRGSRACRQRRDAWMNGSPRRREKWSGQDAPTIDGTDAGRVCRFPQLRRGIEQVGATAGREDRADTDGQRHGQTSGLLQPGIDSPVE